MLNAIPEYAIYIEQKHTYSTVIYGRNHLVLQIKNNNPISVLSTV